MTNSIRLVAVSSCVEEMELSAVGNTGREKFDSFEADTFSSLSTAVVSRLMSDTACCDNTCTGLVLGTVYGPLDASLRCVECVESSDKCASSCLQAFHSVAATHLVRLFGIKGPSVTVTLRTWPFLEALRVAMVMLWSRRVKKMIVVGADVKSQVLNRVVGELFACDKQQHDEECASVGGAVAWMLERVEDGVNGQDIWLRIVDIKECNCDSSFYLLRSGESWVTVFDNEYVAELSGRGSFSPVSYLLALNKSVETVMNETGAVRCMQWIVEAGFGSAFVELTAGRSTTS